MKRIKTVFTRVFRGLKQLNGETHGSGKILLICVLVGFLAAIGAGVFHFAVEGCRHLFLVKLAGDPLDLMGENTGKGTIRFSLLYVPALGGLMSGILVWLLAPEAKGHGTDGVIEAYHHKRGVIRPIVPFVKTIASAITIGTGGSAGKEGPIAQIAAGLASSLGRILHLNYKETRILTIAGLAAGIGAIFHAPLASGIFASEVLYREMEFDKDVLIPSLTASIISYGIYTSFFGSTPLFTTPDLAFTNFAELIPYTIVAIVVAFGARAFVTFFYKMEHFFEKLNMPGWAKPALGGLGVGLVGLFLPQTLSESYGVLQKALEGGEIAMGLFFLIAMGKILTTSLTIGSGGSGGVFGPSMVIGGFLGGGVGMIMKGFMDVDPSAFVIVGMAGFFSAAANTPISTIIMVSEITGSHSLLVPTMWVSTIAYFLGRGSTLYQKQLWNRFEAPAEMGEMMSEILERMTVEEACLVRGALLLVRDNQPISELDELDLIDQREFAVINDQGLYVGVVDRASLRHAKQYLGGQTVLVSDLIIKRSVLQPHDNLKTALRKMITSDVDHLFLVIDGAPVSYLKRQDLITAYDQRMQGVKDDEADTTKETIDIPQTACLKGLYYDVEISDKDMLLSYCADLVGQDDQDAIWESLWDREDLGTTALGEGIAFPHPKEREHARGQADLYIVKLAKGIDYNALDGKPVNLFFLLWCGDSHVHIETLAKLAKLCSKGELQESLEMRISFDQASKLIADVI